MLTLSACASKTAGVWQPLFTTLETQLPIQILVLLEDRQTAAQFVEAMRSENIEVLRTLSVSGIVLLSVNATQLRRRAEIYPDISLELNNIHDVRAEN